MLPVIGMIVALILIVHSTETTDNRFVFVGEIRADVKLT